MFEKIVEIIADVLTEETGIPREEITADTQIPNSLEGFMVIMRMANSIPGGGSLLVTNPSNMCTVGELATQCVDEMEKLRKRIKPLEKVF